ncbi:DUF4116 domain-containing protein [Bacteriovoracales bacterium]|nr:DUF4116 domain-containing protein [Bacteriovoracales bacterium]
MKIFILGLIFFIGCAQKKTLKIEVPVSSTTQSKVKKVPSQIGQITVDFLRIRENPDLKAKTLSFFYKYMMVNILERSKVKTKIKRSNHYWYRVSRKGISGWVFGRFVDLKLKNKGQDLFRGSSNMGWFFKRFSKCYSKKTNLKNCNVQFFTFSLEDYRNLISAAKEGNLLAKTALKKSAGIFFRRYPNEKKFQHLKKGLIENDLLKIITKNDFSEEKKLILNKVKINPNFLKHIPNRYKNDEDVVLSAVKKNGMVLEFASTRLKKNLFLIKTALRVSPKAIKFVNPKLRRQKNLLKIITQKIIKKESSKAIKVVVSNLDQQKKSLERRSPKSIKEECDKTSCFNLGLKKEKSKNFQASKLLFIKSCDLNNSDGCIKVGLHEFLAGNDEASQKMLERSCKMHFSSEKCLGLEDLESKKYEKMERAKILGAIFEDKAPCKTYTSCFSDGKGDEELELAIFFLNKSCIFEKWSACSLLGDIYKKIGKIRNAKMSYEKACDLKYAKGCKERGNIEYKDGNFNLAKHFFKKGCDLLKAGGGCYNLAFILENKENNISGAKMIYKKLCLSNVGYGAVKGCYHLGALNQKENDLQSAKKNYKRACDLGYKLGEFFNTLGRTKRNSFSKMSCSHLGEIERQLGNFESSKIANEKACNLGLHEACL